MPTVTVTVSSDEPPNAIVAKLTRLFGDIPVPMGVLVLPEVMDPDGDGTTQEYRFVTTQSWDPEVSVEVG